MTEKGLDYAWGRPGGAAIKAGGYHFACRYLSHTEGKNLSKSEADDLISHGISIVVVWETIAQRASYGYQAGISDAKDAIEQLRLCGAPNDTFVYFAVDYDAAGSVVAPYFQGAVSVLGKERVGVYGGYRVIRYMLDYKYASKGWQTRAWSNGQWDSRASIRQLGTVTVNGVSCDVNEAYFNDYGQWRKADVMTSVWDEKLTHDGKVFTAGTWMTFTNTKVDAVKAELDALTLKVNKLSTTTATPVIDYPKFVAEFIKQMGAK